jgi:hypothetical protein
MFSKIILLTAISLPVFASYDAAERNYGRGSISLSGYRKTIIELSRDGFYFSVIPWMKDYLVKNNGPLDDEMESALDSILDHTGVKILESLPDELLKRSKASSIHYILAKRLFNRVKYREALAELNRIPVSHSTYPFAAHLKGAVHAALNQHNEATTDFNDCVRSSEKNANKVKSKIQRDQLLTNKDYCLAGVARVQYGAQKYKNSELSYLDIPKESFVWPHILFEEAWNSYYLGNYNRTLGKLVSYKAPVFDFIFKPEIEVLKALSYLKMCLYDDAKRTVDNFYQDLLAPSNELRGFLLSKGKNYRYFYELMADHEVNKTMPLEIINPILRSIRRDNAYIELKGSLTEALAEYHRISQKPATSLRANLSKNIQTVVEEYRNTIGAYVRTGLTGKYAELYSAFQGMSYIKLEVLEQRKERLYQSDVVPGKKRGDVKYIERNDKQYFWTFNGEFWADELGDYVFALRSEC